MTPYSNLYENNWTNTIARLLEVVFRGLNLFCFSWADTVNKWRSWSTERRTGERLVKVKRGKVTQFAGRNWPHVSPLSLVSAFSASSTASAARHLLSYNRWARHRRKNEGSELETLHRLCFFYVPKKTGIMEEALWSVVLVWNLSLLAEMNTGSTSPIDNMPRVMPSATQKNSMGLFNPVFAAKVVVDKIISCSAISSIDLINRCFFFAVVSSCYIFHLHLKDVALTSLR